MKDAAIDAAMNAFLDASADAPDLNRLIAEYERAVTGDTGGRESIEDDAGKSSFSGAVDRARRRGIDPHAVIDGDDDDHPASMVAPSFRDGLTGNRDRDVIAQLWGSDSADGLVGAAPRGLPVLPGDDGVDGFDGGQPDDGDADPAAGPQPGPTPVAADTSLVQAAGGEPATGAGEPVAGAGEPVAGAGSRVDPKESAKQRAFGELISRVRTLYDANSMYVKVGGAVMSLLLVLGIVYLVTVPGERDAGAAADSTNVAAETPPSVAPTVTDGVLQPETVAAECPSGSSQPELAFTGDKRDAWVCVRALGVDGAILSVTFREPVVITEVRIVPGWNYVEASGVDRWTEHRVVSRVLWRFGDDVQMVQNFNPSRTGASMKVSDIATQKVSMTILQTEEPEAAQDRAGGGILKAPKRGVDDFAVGRIEFIGHRA